MSAQTDTTHPELHIPPEKQRRFNALNRYVKATDIPLSVLALVYLVTFSIQSIWYDPSTTWYRWMSIFSNVLWALFAIDLITRFTLTPIKRHFFRRNWLDTITVVLPQFRALRVLRAFTPNGFLANDRSWAVVTGGAATTAAVATVIIVWVGSLMVLDAERGAPNAEITSAGDAVWWAFETITTVGYGDFVPVTWNGRLYAVLIMIVGISVLGVVTATMAATLNKTRQRTAGGSPADTTPAATAPAPDPAQQPTAQAAPAQQPAAEEPGLADLQRELTEIKAMLAALQQQVSAPRTD